MAVLARRSLRAALEISLSALAGLAISAPIGAIALDRTPYAPVAPAEPADEPLRSRDSDVAAQRRELLVRQEREPDGERSDRADGRARHGSLDAPRAAGAP